MEYALVLRNNAILQRYRMNSIPFTCKLLTSLFSLFPLLALCLSNLDPTLGKIQPSHWQESSVESFNRGSLVAAIRYPDTSRHQVFFSGLQTLPPQQVFVWLHQEPKGTGHYLPISGNPSRKTTDEKDQGLAWSKTFSRLLYQQLFINRTIIYPITTFS